MYIQIPLGDFNNTNVIIPVILVRYATGIIYLDLNLSAKYPIEGTKAN